MLGLSPNFLIIPKKKLKKFRKRRVGRRANLQCIRLRTTAGGRPGIID
jgi:hypothetical protein